MKSVREFAANCLGLSVPPISVLRLASVFGLPRPISISNLLNQPAVSNPIELTNANYKVVIQNSGLVMVMLHGSYSNWRLYMGMLYELVRKGVGAIAHMDYANNTMITHDYPWVSIDAYDMGCVFVFFHLGQHCKDLTLQGSITDETDILEKRILQILQELAASPRPCP
ncbi:MAG: hypothetical protein ACXVIP_05315 [Halobacteriota archaeon]